VQRGRAAEHGLEAALDPREELGFGDLAALQRVQRVHPVVLQAVRHRGAVGLERDVDLVLHAVERLQQRRGQDAAEVGDHSLDHARRSTS
jgi:hypothetical protein